MEPITAAEASAIRSLKRLAKKWPKSLWLFSASGTLTVMKCDDKGERVYTKDYGANSAFVLDQIEIPNDGGDW